MDRAQADYIGMLDLNITRLECKYQICNLISKSQFLFEYHQIGM